jgi:hypothetical protein
LIPTPKPPPHPTRSLPLFFTDFPHPREEAKKANKKKRVGEEEKREEGREEVF